MVAASDAVISCGVVHSKCGDCLHHLGELASGEDWVLTAGAADVSAGLRRDCIFVAVESAGESIAGRGDCQRAESALARLVVSLVIARRDRERAETALVLGVLHGLLIRVAESWSSKQSLFLFLSWFATSAGTSFGAL